MGFASDVGKVSHETTLVSEQLGSDFRLPLVSLIDRAAERCAGQQVARLACTMRQKGVRIDARCAVDSRNRERHHVTGGTGQADARRFFGAPAQRRRKSDALPIFDATPPIVEAGSDVVDDFLTAIPVAARELEVIEAYLGALLGDALGHRE